MGAFIQGISMLRGLAVQFTAKSGGQVQRGNFGPPTGKITSSVALTGALRSL
jgi:hypothetical protein